VPLFLLGTGSGAGRVAAPFIEPFGAITWNSRAILELLYLVIFPTLLALPVLGRRHAQGQPRPGLQHLVFSPADLDRHQLRLSPRLDGHAVVARLRAGHHRGLDLPEVIQGIVTSTAA